MSDPIPFRHPPVLPMTEEQRAYLERISERRAAANQALDEAAQEVRAGMRRQKAMAEIMRAILPKRDLSEKYYFDANYEWPEN